jgi:hypothetical protein
MLNTTKCQDAKGTCGAFSLRRVTSFAMALLLSVFLASCGEVEAMGEVVLFSALNGKLLDKGKPVAGATLERETKWRWGKETIKDATTTATDGAFSFPAVKRKMLLGSLLPHEAVIEQTISVSYGGKSYMLWATDKRDYENNGELSYVERGKTGIKTAADPKKPMSVTCRLDGEPHHNGNVFGLCDFN